MTNNNEDATETVPGTTAAALANAATICNEVIAASGNNNETTQDDVTANPTSSTLTGAAMEGLDGNKKQVSGMEFEFVTAR